MGKENFKKVLSIVLAATVMLVFSFTTVFAEEGSPQNTPTTQPTKATTKATTKAPAKATTKKASGSTTIPKIVGEYKLDHKSGTAALTKVKKSSQKKIKKKTITNSVKYNGKTYKVTKINAKAFAKCKKLKTIVVKGKYLKTVSKKAFKGLKKSQIKKIKVKISKKNKNYKSLKKQFKKAGIKSKNITFY